MQRSMSSNVRPSATKTTRTPSGNPDHRGGGHHLADKIEAELIGAKPARRKRHSYADERPSVAELGGVSSTNIAGGRIVSQPRHRLIYQPEPRRARVTDHNRQQPHQRRRRGVENPGMTAMMSSTDEDRAGEVDDESFEDEELEAVARNRASHHRSQRSDSIDCSDDEDEEPSPVAHARVHDSWSNKKNNSQRRMNGGDFDFDMTETGDSVSMADEKDPRYHSHRSRDNMADGGMAAAAPVFHSSSSRVASKTTLNSENDGGDWARGGMQQSQPPPPQQQHMSQQSHRQKSNVVVDDRHATVRKESPPPPQHYPVHVPEHYPTEYPLPTMAPPDHHTAYHHREGGGGGGHHGGAPAPEKVHTKPMVEKPIAQQRPSKHLSFAPQVPADNGRPPLPLDAKKLQQAQAAQRQQQKKMMMMQEKRKRFPIEDISEAKKGTKVETVPETCRIHVLSWIENGTRRFLWHLARRLTSVPTLTVVIPLIVCALATVGVIIRRDTLHMEAPFRSFYTADNDQANFPSSSIGIQQIAANDYFNASNPRYDSFQRSGAEGGAEFAVIMRTEDHNVLEEEAIESYLRLRKKVEEIKIVNGQKIYKYSSLCRRTQKDSCQKDVVETLMTSGKMIKFHYPETSVPTSLTKSKDDKSPAASTNNSSTTTFFIGNTFGGVETDQDAALAKAETLAMYFKLKPPPKTDAKDVTAPGIAGGANGGVDVLRSWDEEFQRVMRDEELAHSRGKAGSISWWSYGAFSAEVLATFKQIYLYLAASMGVFVLGSLLASFKGSSYTSKPGLGLIGGVIIFLVVGGGWCVEIGITGYINPAIFPAFFFIAATALHFMINTLQSWRKYSSIAMDPAERMRIVFSWDAPCVLWTCLIISIGYLVTAAVVNMPFYRSVSQFLAASSFLIIFLVLLLFAGAMYIGGKRELAGLKWFQCGTITAEWPPALIRRYHMRDVQLIQKKMRDERPQALRTLGECAASVHARYVALLVFCIYLIFAAWGCSLVPIRINERQFIRSSTNLHQFLDDYGQFYGRYDNYLIMTFHDSVDYFDARVRTAILDMLGWMETQEHVAERTISWLREFIEFEKSSIYLINHDTFVPVVDLIFLKEGSAYQRFAADIAFGRYREQIVASRMYVELNSVGMQRQLEIVKTLTAKAADARLPLTIRTPTSFLLQHDVQLTYTTLIAMLVLIGIMGVLSFLIFAQPHLSLLTVLGTISVAVGTIGFTALWDVPVNALNMGAVLAAVAHSAALCMSCCYQYGNSGDVTAVRRMAFTFQSWFPGAIWSSAIGLAAFAPLLFVDCQIVQHLAKIVLCHFLSILIHVTVFLPPCLVLLTTSVPSCCQFMKRMCEESCFCCSSDEDATSIYYIPTGGRPLDPIYVQQFYQLKFREDILPPPPVHPLPPPPVREMLMPPPPRGAGGGPPSSIGDSAVGHHLMVNHHPDHHHHPHQYQHHHHPHHQEQPMSRCISPQPMLDSRMHSARSSMQQRPPYVGGPSPTTKVYRYGSNHTDFEDVMRARTARAAYDKRHMSMSPDVTDPSHRSRHVSPEVHTPTRVRRRANTASPLGGGGGDHHQQPRRQRHDSEEIYHEPSDPESVSMRTTNTDTQGRPTEHQTTTLNNRNSATSPTPNVVTIDSGDEDGLMRPSKHTNNKSLKPYENRIVEVDSGTIPGAPKSKITYAKWSKEVPIDPFTTERVTAEKYTIEGDGGTIDLPPDWKRYWIKGNLKRQAGGGGMGMGPEMAGMGPPPGGDHHHHHQQHHMPMHHHHAHQMPGHPGAGHFVRHPPPSAFRHPSPGSGPMGGEGPPMMMPPYGGGAPPPLPPRPPFGLPRAAGGGGVYRGGQAQPGHFRKTPAWMY